MSQVKMPSVTEKKIEIAGDDLEDGLEYEIQSSGDENESFALSEGEDIEKEEETSSVPVSKTESAKGKKRKSGKDDKLHLKKKQKMEYDINLKRNLSLESEEIIAEKLASKVASQNKDLSPLELSEMYIDKRYIRSSSDFKQERNLANLSVFIKDKFDSIISQKTAVAKPKKKKTPKRQDKVATLLAKKLLLEGKQDLEGNGADQIKKYITVLSMSAIRSCDVQRATKEHGSLKLIKKNKLKDDLLILSKSNNRILAATPNRMTKILDEPNSTITESNLKVIILDSSYLDTKLQNVLDLAETLKFLRRITDHNKDVEIYLY